MVLDLNKVPVNSRNGFYGGLAGSKEGVDINGEPWIIKYPQSTAGMRGELAPYTTAPLSEYIGSHVYERLGIPVHQTELGIRNGFLVVACKDFCEVPHSLIEFREVKNTYNEELNEKLKLSLSDSISPDYVALEDMMVHFQHNPVLKKMPEVTERFWSQLIVDVLINNNDRNNGNWGFIHFGDSLRLSPVYDNGNAFSNKLSDAKLSEIVADPSLLKQSVNSSRTVYALSDKRLFATQIGKIEDPEFKRTVLTLVPKIQSQMDGISTFIQNIPEEYQGISVCSGVRKEFYIQSLKARLDMILTPLYNNIAEILQGI